MYEKIEKVGVDLATNEEIIRIVLVWEQDKETAEEFFKKAARLHYGHEQRIMHKCIHIYIREKLHDKKRSSSTNEYDNMFTSDYIQAKKPKKSKF